MKPKHWRYYKMPLSWFVIKRFIHILYAYYLPEEGCCFYMIIFFDIFLLLPLWLEGEETFKYRSICQPLYGKVYYSKKRPWAHAKMRFYRFWSEIPFLSKFGQRKIKTVSVSWKFGSYTNSNMQSSTVVLAFSVLDQKHPFWATLDQKIKIDTLSCNLVPRLIGICRIQ